MCALLSTRGRSFPGRPSQRAGPSGIPSPEEKAGLAPHTARVQEHVGASTQLLTVLPVDTSFTRRQALKRRKQIPEVGPCLVRLPPFLLASTQQPSPASRCPFRREGTTGLPRAARAPSPGTPSGRLASCGGGSSPLRSWRAAAADVPHPKEMTKEQRSAGTHT